MTTESRSRMGRVMRGLFATAASTEEERFLAENRSAASRRQLKVISMQVGILVGGLVIWELISGTLLSEFWISKPSLIFAKLVDWVATGALWSNMGYTFIETIFGFLVGAAIGFVIGVGLGQSRLLSDVLNPFVAALNSLPKIALAPLFIMWLGIGLTMKITLAASIVFFFVFSNTYSGVRNVEQNLIDIVKTMGASRTAILTKVVLPSALLWVFTGLRVSIPYALIGAIVGEIFASNQGIGYLIQRSSSQFDTAGVFAGLFVLTIMAVVFLWILGLVERRVLRWQI